MTGKYARDIKTICTECISQMHIDKEVWIVEVAHLYVAIENAHKERPRILPMENFKKFQSRRSVWLDDIMRYKLIEAEKIAMAKHPLMRLSDSYTIGIIEKIASSIGIAKEPIPETDNLFFRRNIDTTNLRVWNYKGKKSLVSYQISSEAPMGNTFLKMIE